MRKVTHSTVGTLRVEAASSRGRHTTPHRAQQRHSDRHFSLRCRLAGTGLAVTAATLIGACSVPAPARDVPAPAAASSAPRGMSSSDATINTSTACLAWQFLDAANALRSARSMQRLTMVNAAVATAGTHSAAMSRGGSLYHSELASSADRGFGRSNWSKAGENVGRGATMRSVQDALVNSPSHFAAMIDPAYNAVGIGVVVSGSRVYVTELFGRARTMPAVANRPRC